MAAELALRKSGHFAHVPSSWHSSRDAPRVPAIISANLALVLGWLPAGDQLGRAAQDAQNIQAW